MIETKAPMSTMARKLARLVLGCVFIYASIDKLAFPREFANLVTSYGILPEIFATYFAYVLPWVELVLGAFLMGGIFIRITSKISLSVLLVFLVAIGIQALKGQIRDCGCFGETSFLATSNIGIMIFRDLAFIALALFVVMTNRTKSVR
jgi:uncharacterized membrane protein YphA (DoxX/SURF4 family)